MRSLPFSRRSRGFSLIELIVVISIITLMSFVIVPTASTVIIGSDVTRGSQIMTAQLALARQTAVTKNHSVEVRFLKYGDSEQPGEKPEDPSTGHYRGIALLEVFENGSSAMLGKVERLPGNVIMDEKRLSSLLDTTQAAEPNQRAATEVDAQKQTDAPPLPKSAKGQERNYKYVAFRYQTDGSTNLPMTGKWYVTLYSGAEAKRLKDSGDPGINYFTAQVDPASGSVRSFRPTAGSKDAGGTSGG